MVVARSLARSSWTSLASEAKMILIIASETKRKQGYVRKKNKKMSTEICRMSPCLETTSGCFFVFLKVQLANGSVLLQLPCCLPLQTNRNSMKNPNNASL